ncbi:putative bifunctional diguanylate cyclase/phosphodiesterase [Halopseudomonas salegens]|uniref:cyclic-guanylate-specific phosphodiesterase n=1 Tax=Halopseudomonas salegens TaxID=1434072 RepID=A0A1H2HV46_9GAMM|nr:EAL domain-containing protein [Halopseudomonas salegens]SDU35606.1 diguanylate cyclase/phosphodiesterase with PAS/PAC sensor(s) [Halopseudomonas salegens]
MSSNRGAWQITLIYLVVSALWILLSDNALTLVGLSTELQQRLQTVKGLAFISITSGLIFFLTRNYLRRRRQQERELRISEQRFELALAGSQDGVWDWHLNSDQVHFSRQCRVMLGFPADSQADLGGKWASLLHPEDSAAAKQALRDHLAGRTSRFQHVHRLRHQHEGYRWFEASGRALRDPTGKPWRILGTLRDVTAQKESEERLRQAAVVFDSTTEGVVITNAHNQILNVNQAFCQITGYSADEAIGAKPNLLKSGWHDASFYQAMWQSLEHEGNWQGEVWNRRKNGEIYPQWQTINSVRDADGKLTHYVAVFADISKIKRSEQEIDFLAHNDPLTRLPNRLLLNERLENAIQRAKRQNEKVGLIFIDLDRFKAVNDSLGHSAGDELLRAAAMRMLARSREQDTLARLGGDEFVLLVDDIQATDALIPVAKRLLACFDKPFDIDQQALHLTVSLGISLFPDDASDARSLLTNADTALTLAKDNGRNTYAFYTQALTQHARERIALESSLHQAISGRQLRVYYQPQVDLGTGHIIGLEALVRWQHPEHGLLTPDRFLPVAVNAGLMISIDEYVLNQACQQMQRWLAAGFDLQHMAVNMSGSWLERGQVVDSVKQALARNGLHAQYLELELTETEAMRHSELNMERLDSLRHLGISLAIDDFGTGYSSLMRLKRLPVNRLKIDRDFVRDLPHDQNDAAIARAIIALGQSLQMELIAEGVETVEQAELLTAMGCTNAQGYLYSRPVPAAEIEPLLQHVGSTEE